MGCLDGHARCQSGGAAPPGVFYAAIWCVHEMCGVMCVRCSWCRGVLVCVQVCKYLYGSVYTV